MADFQSYAGMSATELDRELEKTQREVLSIRLHLVAGQDKDHSKLKKARKDVARLMTARRQKQLGISPAA